jgi:TonB-linked SusC/RagA family outer membrane protein
MMTRFRWRHRTALTVALLVIPLAAKLSAQGTISGVVTSAESKQPLGDARVLVIGGTALATTTEDGHYILRNVPVGTAQIQVLHVGYRSAKRAVTVAAGAPVTADFELTQAVVQLQEVVTTATGQSRRSELGNAVTTFGDVGKKVEEAKISTVADLMQSRAPGVVVLPQTTLGGAPTVRIRGVSSISLNNSPIYYVDGVRYGADQLSSGTDTRFSLLNQLNPDEIEDMEIVKGPSAATLYGTNAANGVVLITTKKGRAGRARWTWFGEQGAVLDRSPYQDMYAAWGHSVGNPATLLRCQNATMNTSAFINTTLPAAQQCVRDSLTHYNLLDDHSDGDGPSIVHTGKTNTLGLNVSGGTEQVRYFVSGDLNNTIGPIQMPGYELRRFDSLHVGVRDEWKNPSAEQRASFRTNLSASLSPKVDVSLNTSFAKMDNRIPPESDLIIALYYVQMQNYGFKGPGLDKLLTDQNGTPLHDSYQWAPGDIMQYVNESDVQRTTASANTNWRPFSWMVNDGTVGVDLSSIDFFHICRLEECPPQSQTARTGNVTDNRANLRNFSAKVTSTSSWNYKPWMNLKTSVGADYTNVEVDSLSTTGQGLPPGAERVTQAAIKNVNAQYQPQAVKTLGLYAQEELALRDRLFLTAAVRTDQNSAFGSKFQRVVYPKAQVSWLMSDEPFFPAYSWLNSFRLRTSYGASGVQPGATQALVTFSANSVSLPGRAVTTATDVPGLTANQIGNSNLKPETSAELEAGFEAQILNSRAHIDYTFYRKQTKDAIISVPIAPSGAPSQLNQLQNVGSTRNTGHEVALNAQLVDLKRIGWDVTIAGSHNTNVVVDLGIDPASGKARIIGAGGQTRQIAGYPLNSQWFRGYTYHDDNGDGVLQVGEVHVDSAFQYRGYNAARDIFSITNGVDLFNRKLRINAMFDYKGGGNLTDGANNFQCTTSPNACRETQDPTAPLWMQARAIAKLYGTRIGSTTFKTSGGYFQSDQFWRFRELSAVWQMPNVVVRQVRATDGSTLVLAVRNIHWWGSFTGIDPEANYGLSGSDSQNEFQTAGAPTYVTLRLNLKY